MAKIAVFLGIPLPPAYICPDRDLDIPCSKLRNPCGKKNFVVVLLLWGGKMKNGFHARMSSRRVKAIFLWKPRARRGTLPRQSAIEAPVRHIRVEAYCENDPKRP